MATALENVQDFFPEVNRVKDGKKKLKIEVTPKDTSSAKVKKHRQCAMALACKRKFDLDGVIVSVRTAYLVKGNKAIRYQLPESVSREIVSFDRKAGFREGEYTLRPFPASMRIGAPQRGRRAPHKKAGKKHFKHVTQGIRGTLGTTAAR